MPAPRSAWRPKRHLGAALLMLLSTGCAVAPDPDAQSTPSSFEAYRRRSVDRIEKERVFQTGDRGAESAWNAPSQLEPAPTPALNPAPLPGDAKRPTRGILLVHGLGDSPWSFSDVGKVLAAQGFLVRTVLLPGHGTKPADLLGVTLEDWQRTVAEQADILSREVEQIYLGGFSTGANLAVEYALAHPHVRGLVLFSPALRLRARIGWFAPLLPLVKSVMPWLMQPDGPQPQQTPLRYVNVPTNGFAQYYRSSRSVRRELALQSFDKPVLMVMTQHDSVIDGPYALGVFATRFTHPASQLIWYGTLPDGQAALPRVLVRPDRLPDERISQFSHMSLLFSPANPLYGRAGTQRMCNNGQDSSANAECLAGAPVWYSDWGYREPSKVHARLTFNPYFDWQANVLKQVMARAARNGD